ncbi:MAG: hydrogenase [Elusimicrobia bacterium GWC2_51_8]|nr:MAG: hydrogenase [Elusimicrobia bacterium GWA2_51_34]OGR60271.1 MAG: hydrogenase [Elusimicrobia bacterium GWC2_51_8]OGR86106.1 MAG: hydrogenase [Elusimicrobia bacterium GWF2_52_66]HAF96079.1 hydrogenase [Elusimicrobiota bacterium]HCE98687.1 hydrogenase [Elusimicrobiota bacterium]
MMRILWNSFKKGVLSRKIGKIPASLRYEKTGEELRSLIIKKFGRSLHIREVDTGSCGACESEIISATNPIYDIQRFGVDFVASPRHADALLVTGPVSRNMALALKRTYEAMPEPKFVITCGDCALNGGAFKDSYYSIGEISKIVPVAAHIPGCPPHPLAILDSLLRLMGNPVT